MLSAENTVQASLNVVFISMGLPPSVLLAWDMFLKERRCRSDIYPL